MIVTTLPKVILMICDVRKKLFHYTMCRSHLLLNTVCCY